MKTVFIVQGETLWPGPFFKDNVSRTELKSLSTVDLDLVEEVGGMPTHPGPATSGAQK